jgi:signal transduction histidine kinase
MSDIGWLLAVLLQFAPGDAPVVWYGVVFILAMLVIAAGIGFWMARTEADSQPPIDHEMLLNAFEDPIVVLDHENDVLVANVPFRSLFETDIEGESIEAVLDSVPAVKEAVLEREQAVLPIESAGETRHYDIHAYPAGREPRPPRKWVIFFHDVTDNHERQSQLEAEKEQLDRFAGLLSHDIRNPLDVAIGRTNAVKESVDDPEHEQHLSRAQEAHQRIQQIIRDVLALVRGGHNIDERATVPLETAATDAWSLVETGTSTLVINTQLVIRADREQLTRIFENLFRNAVQHAGPDVTVRVETLPSGQGFYIADDGDGIPSGDRNAVLEAGVSGDGDGTGLGLAIVSSLAEAHGWELTVTESASGGAQFEFSGVDLVADESASTELD